ncbi:MAG TPA: diacylglycerol kinase family protein [Polyangiaceae bacterium]|jgi:YegS/Rv2252/BmrU family lipid kinase|nr:diacylglycerol kinase family protein [Polyangiaceae bacterium]
MKLRLLVNPTAGSGSAARRVPLVKRALEERGIQAEIAETRAPGDATRLVHEARRDGVECLLVMGGDGTLNEVSQGYIDAEGRPLPGPDLALLPSGTGGDFRKTFELGTSLEEAIERLASAPARPLDLGLLELTAHSGATIRRAFLNITSFGLGGLTDRLVNAGPKWIGGRTAFFVGTLRAMVSYRNAPVRVRVDGKVCLEAPILNVAIANGRFFGGGMQIAPEADPGDGLFDVVALHDLTRTQGLALAHRIYQGSHVGQPGVRVARGSVIEAESLVPRAEVLIDMDGETPGRLPLVARVAPGALKIRA